MRAAFLLCERRREWDTERDDGGRSGQEDRTEVKGESGRSGKPGPSSLKNTPERERVGGSPEEDSLPHLRQLTASFYGIATNRVKIYPPSVFIFT